MEEQIILETPFGKIPLAYEKVKMLISNSTFGTKRKVVFEGLNSMTIEGEFCNIVWIVNHFDDNDEFIINPDLNNSRKILTPVSGKNKVTDQGVTIERKLYPEGEAGDQAYQTALDTGYNEFTFWMAMIEKVPLPQVLGLAVTILDQFGRFDEIK